MTAQSCSLTGSLSSMPTTNSFSMRPLTSLHVLEQKQRVLVQLELSTLTKPDGYIWIGSKDNLLHVPRDQADDVEITESDIAKEVEDTLPRVEVKVRPRPQEEEKKEDVSSQQEEETSQHAGHAENAKIPAMPRGRTADERYGNLIIQQLTPEHQEQLRMCAFNSRKVQKTGIQKESTKRLIKLALLARSS